MRPFMSETLDFGTLAGSAAQFKTPLGGLARSRMLSSPNPWIPFWVEAAPVILDSQLNSP